MAPETDLTRRGRNIALLVVATALAWIGALAVGDWLGWTQRVLAFFDLTALAGFAMALWLLFGLWRSRRNGSGPEKGPEAED